MIPRRRILPFVALLLLKALAHGRSTLRIIVANLAINEMAGSALPDYRLLDSRYGERFTPQDMQNLQPLPSGLLGTIRIIAARTN